MRSSGQSLEPGTNGNGSSISLDDVVGRLVRARERDRRAEQRDVLAEARDTDADARAESAAARDETAEREDRALMPRLSTAALHRLSDSRSAAALERHEAAEDRWRSKGERQHAKADRLASHADRDLSMAVLRAHERDDLTGVYRRGPGLLELSRELSRVERTGATLTVAFVDVDHLKTVNDTAGHEAGDHLLVQVAEALRTHARPYDPVLRYGGDEFVCVFADMEPAEVTARLGEVGADLAQEADGASITAGIAEAREGDSVDSLVSRADQALREARALRVT